MRISTRVLLPTIACTLLLGCRYDIVPVSTQPGSFADTFAPKMSHVGHLFYAVYVQSGKVMLATSADAKSWTSTPVSGSDTAVSDPAITVTPSKTVIVVWKSGNNWRYRWATPCNTGTTVTLGPAAVSYDMISIGEEVYIAYEGGAGIFFRKSQATQPNSATDIPIAPLTLCTYNTNYTMPQIAGRHLANGHDELMLAYYHYSNESSIQCTNPPPKLSGPIVRASTDGGATWGPGYAALVSLTQSDTSGLSLALDGNSGVYQLAWSQVTTNGPVESFATGAAGNTFWTRTGPNPTQNRRFFTVAAGPQPAAFNIGYTEVPSGTLTYSNTYTETLTWSGTTTSGTPTLVSALGQNLHAADVTYCYALQRCNMTGVYEERVSGSNGYTYGLLSQTSCTPGCFLSQPDEVGSSCK